MLKFSPFRTAIIVIVALLGLVYTIPNFLSKDQLAAWPPFLPKQTMVLGLDLQGGSYLLLQINRQGVINDRLQELRRDARNLLANQNGIANLITVGKNSLSIELTDPQQRQKADELLQKLQNNVGGSVIGVGGVPELAYSDTPDGRIKITLTDQGIDQRMSSLVTQAMQVISKRIDQIGTTEPSIQRQGSNRILVQVPGYQDSSRLKEIISKTARLTFHMVYPGMTAAQAKQQGLPPDTEILPSQDGGEELIYDDVALGGESLVDAQPGFDQQTGRSVVSFRFDTRGAVTFGDITSKNVGKRFAVVLDNQVITAPVIQTPITGGTGQITGNFTPQSANDLAVLLRAGALPVSLDIVEERSVGPSLGADSVHDGIMAGVVGGTLVIVFMIAAYGLFGIFADLAVSLNVLLILGGLSMLGATLTLPGIAGIVLTIGMSVDANVLIYERIREEVAAGRSVVGSIEAGYKHAIATIVDAHVTNLIAAVVLFFLGTGTVQGFAVTLALGIITSLFTAYFVTLFIVGRWYAIFRPKRIRVQLMRIIPDGTKIPFMNWRKIFITLSLVTSILSIGWFFYHGLNLGIDFVGGSVIEVQAQNGPADPGQVREQIGKLGLKGDAEVQGFGTPSDLLIRIQTQGHGEPEAQQAAVAKVGDALTADHYSVRRTETVGPTVSSELAISGAEGLIVSIIAILIYVWFRFEWQFAIGSIIATAHDTILTLGFFAVSGIEFNATSIASILTIIGYSLNDTVVIYDRIREYLRKYRKMPLHDLIDVSINSTLPRTVLTSVTTLLALISLVFFGGEVIRSFTVSMTFGVVVGTYSSIFIASPILIYLGLKARPEQTEKEKEKAKAAKRADGAAV
jgi:SecD/SecF fusion protein